MADRPRLIRVSTIPAFLWSFVDGQARFMAEKGFEVHGVASPGPVLDRFGEREGVSVHAVPMYRRISPGADLVGMARLTRLFRGLRPHIVHGSTPKAAALSMYAAALARVPVRIYHAPGLRWWTLGGLRRRLLMAAQRRACALADAVLCAGPSVRDALVEHRICPADRTIVLGHGHTNGVDARGRFDPAALAAGTRQRVRAQLGIPPNAVVVGFVGRLTGDKGIEQLTRAWPLIHDCDPAAHLLLAGDFEEFDPVSAQCRELLSADPSVTLVGWIDDVVPIYAAMDICIIPTHREGFPTIALEAGAMGLPVVGTNAIGCIDAIVQGETGVMVEVGDTSGLVAAVSAYLDDADLRRRHGAAGRERVVRHFDRELIWREMRDHYVRLLAERGLPLPAAAPTADPAHRPAAS